MSFGGCGMAWKNIKKSIPCKRGEKKIIKDLFYGVGCFPSPTTLIARGPDRKLRGVGCARVPCQGLIVFKSVETRINKWEKSFFRTKRVFSSVQIFFRYFYSRTAGHYEDLIFKGMQNRRAIIVFVFCVLISWRFLQINVIVIQRARTYADG